MLADGSAYVVQPGSISGVLKIASYFYHLNTTNSAVKIIICRIIYQGSTSENTESNYNEE